MRYRFLPLLGLLTLALFAGGCATAPKEPAALAEFKANNDPLEPLNRKTFAFNLFLDRSLFKPIARSYRAVIPTKGRNAIRNFLGNLSEPLVFGHTVLQGRWTSAGITLDRFFINTTLGVGGLGDPAKRHGLEQQIGDAGQTLHVWGFGEGPYLVVPVTGPSNPRDFVGSFADIYGEPIRYVADANGYSTAYSIGHVFVKGIDVRAEKIDTLDALQKQSIDFYAAMRSLVRQKREAELNLGVPNRVPTPDNFYDDPGATK